MLLLMTLGTGIGTSDEDALSRLVRSCSFAIHSYRPARVIYFCSEKSEGTIEPVHQALTDQFGISPPPLFCMSLIRTFLPCFELSMVGLSYQKKNRIEASSGPEMSGSKGLIPDQKPCFL
jgi:hypothetical protein